MFRTIKLKLPYDTSLLETGKRFREACQIVLDYGLSAHTFNKNKLNRATYENVRNEIPTLPSALVQTARDTASEALKQTDLEKKIHRTSLTIRYDRRTFKFYPDSHTVSLTTVKGRLVFPVAKSPLIDKYRGEYTNAQVLIDTKHRKMSVMVQVEILDKGMDGEVNKEINAIGIDRGVKNIAVLSNNMFFNSGHLKDVKGRYRYNKARLQHAGTRSAHRKLKDMSGRERRFVRNTNHVISKRIVNLPFNVIALEELESAKMRKKRNGRRFNGLIGSWSPYQLEQFIEYKAEDMGKAVVYVDPRYTSQKCSKCGYTDKNNRKGSIFHCLNCNFQLHADLNASRNIEVFGKSEYFRLLSTSQSLRLDETSAECEVETSNKPTPSGEGS
jgi:IS605 OrfB family transposase